MSSVYGNGKIMRGYRLFLSEKDEYVPDNYYSITEIFSNPDMALPGYSKDEWCLGENRLKEMRKETFENVRSRYRQMHAEWFNKYWNSNILAINLLGLNEFAKLTCFTELASVMIAFETRVETKFMKGSKRKYVSFGISKANYEKYKKAQAKALKQGLTYKPIKLIDKHIPQTRNKIYQETVLIFGNSRDKNERRSLEMDKNDVYLAFEDWCKRKRKQKKASLYEAMIMLMESDPAEGMPPIETYEPMTNIEKIGFIQEKPLEKEKKGIWISLEDNIMKKIDEIIYRYNNDNKNRKKPKITKARFIRQSIIFYIKHLPLKYTDNLAYQEYMKIKETKEYNEKISNS